MASLDSPINEGLASIMAALGGFLFATVNANWSKLENCLDSLCL